MTHPFGIAVIGLDHWYTAFGVCETTHQSGVARLVAIADPAEYRRQWAEKEYPEVVVTDDTAAAMTRDDVDLVAICAPTRDAPALASQALAAGKHVVAVKPSAPDRAVLQAVVEASRQADRFFGSFEGMQRLHPKARLLKHLIEDGAIGTVLSLHQVGHGGLPSPWPGQPGGAPSWWIDPDCISTGAWLDHAIYAIDLARFAIGGEIVSVSGTIGNRVHAALPMEDYGIALMTLSSPTGPVSLVVEDTWAAEPGGGAHWMRVVGTHGWIEAEGAEWVVHRDGTQTRHRIDDSPFFPIDPLATALRGGTALPFGPEDALANLGACLDFYSTAQRQVP